AEVLARTVPAYQGMPTAVLSRETVSKFDMSNINSELLRHGHLIYTPVIGTGVSITLKDHFDHVCPLLSNSIGTASDAMQFVNRVRHPRHRGLLIGSLGGGRSPAPWESDPEQVLRVLFAREEATLQRIGFIRQLPAELAVLHDGHRVLNPDSLAYCKFLALVHAEKVLDGEGRVIKAFLERLEANGGKIYEYRTEKPTVGAKAASKARKAEKEVVVEERVQEIVAAPIPEASKVEEIKRRGPKSKNEANILRKAGIEAFYGEGTGSDEATIKFDDRGRGRTQARRYAHAVVGVEKGAGLTTLQGMDRREIEEGTTAIRQRHRALRAEGMAALLRRLGVAPLKEGTQVDPQKAADLAEWATTTGAPLMLLLGITVRRDAKEKPMQLASAIVRACGLELLPQQHRVGGVVTRTYTLSGVEEVASYASTYLGKIRSGRILSDVEGEEVEAELPGGCLSWAAAEELIRELAEAA
ncbi:MAG TPA: hypothetical protein PKY30_16535, partial [Myxococcota bacterium]|nr:hypothetical protein [Myxococcota bacterium]